MKRALLLAFLFCHLSACSLLYPGYSNKEPSLEGVEINRTTYREALSKYGPPAISVLEYPYGARMTYFFRTPEATVDRGLIMRGSYQNGCRKCGKLTLAFERRGNSPDDMVLVGVARYTPALEATCLKGLEQINRGNFQEALPFIEAAAQAHYSDAEATLGLMYVNGDGVARDYARARFWFERAAAAGHAQGLYELGVLYRNGEGVPVNRQAAKMLFERAAQAGFATAARELAKLHEEGGADDVAPWRSRAMPAAPGGSD